MSSQYPVLNDRRIDQWKVTELKEELRRRKLKTTGLKEALVKRLGGALRAEMEEAKKEEESGNEEAEMEEADKVDHDKDDDPQEVDREELAPVFADENVEPRVEPIDDRSNKAVIDAVIVDNNDIKVDVNQGSRDEELKEMPHTTSDAAVEDTIETIVPIEDNATGGQIGVGDQHHLFIEKNEDSKPSPEGVTLTISEASYQVSEVKTDLGLQVKSESISTDSVSINEKNELKDNLNANNVHLELEVVKLEMVQPSSSDFPTSGGDSDSLKDDKELVDNLTSLEEAGDDSLATDMELCKKIEGIDGGSPEKLNLDRSSGDESMEEDVETKPIESKNNSNERERKEESMEDILEVAKPIDALMGVLSPNKHDMLSSEEKEPTAAAEKRTADDQGVVKVTTEPKRQRRWNPDTVKAPEPQTSKVTINTPKDAFQPMFRKSFSKSDSSLSGDAPKERIVPTSQKPATSSLRIDNFLRPFTLKAVQELLANTGTVSEFWMDQIKTHCYVTYSSVEEAMATRNALYNLQWPTNGGRLLVAEFVDPQEVKARLQAPLQSPAAVTPSPKTPGAPPFQRQPPSPPASHPNNPRQPMPPPPALSNPPPGRARVPPPPPPQSKPEPPPILTLDDIFKKTAATPRIYYLPLSEEQVAAKLQASQGN